MKKTIFKKISILSFLCFISCSLIQEEDIEDIKITNETPIDQTTIQGTTFQFRWTEVQDVDEYRIQAILNNSIVLDSFVTNNYLNYTLADNTYSWRVRGENFAYKTEYSEETSFTTVSTDNLSNELIILSSPKDETYTNSTNINFSWENVINADSYEVQITKNSNEIILPFTSITTNNYSPLTTLFDTDALYTWSVRALNSSTNTQTENFSRDLFLDTTSPNITSLTTPTANESISSQTDIIFEWLTQTDSGTIQSDIHYDLEFSTVSNFESTFTKFSNLSSNSKTTNFSIENVYYWRVITTDKAGNQIISDTQSFSIN